MSQTRRLENWLDSYLDFHSETESALQFHKWVGMYVIAAALRKKVHLELGMIKIYPNLYVVLVAEPGIARKTQAISYGIKFIRDVPDLQMCADAITAEAMLQDLETAQAIDIMPDGTEFTHCSLNVVSREFESFLGQKKENTKMLVLLTDLFDCEEMPWRYRTKNSGSNIIPAVFLNLIAATTPESLASSLPSTAIGGGLTSRMLFVWASGKQKKVTFPIVTPEMELLKDDLHSDLFQIARISGVYTFSGEAAALWDDWYQLYEETDSTRICQDPSFNGWYARKPMYIQKLSMILTASKTNDLVIEWKAIQDSMEMIEDIERSMSRVFSAVGKSMISEEVSSVMAEVKKCGRITEQQLFSKFWKNIDAEKFKVVAATMIKTGLVEWEIEFLDKQKNRIRNHYIWKGDKQ